MIKKRMTEYMYDKVTKKHFAKLWKEIDFKKANIVKLAEMVDNFVFLINDS